MDLTAETKELEEIIALATGAGANNVLFEITNPKYTSTEILFNELGYLIGKYALSDEIYILAFRDALMATDLFGIGDDKVDAVFRFVDSCIDKARPMIESDSADTSDDPDSVKNRYKSRIRTHVQAKRDYAKCEYIIDGLIWAQSIGIWFGPSGIKKTLLLQNMMACIAGGHDFLPSAPNAPSSDAPTFTTNKTAVLWIDYDNGERTTNTRHAAAAAGVGLADDDRFYAMSEAEPWLELDNIRHIIALADVINEVGGIGIVFIDALGLVTGEVDENSPDMSIVMRNAKRLRGLTGAAIHVVHHPNKASKGQDTDSRNAAGNAKITNFAEFVVEMAQGNNDDMITCNVTKNREYVSDKTFSGIFAYDHMADTSDLEKFTFLSTVALSPAQQKEETVRDAIIHFLEENEPGTLNKTRLRDLAKYYAEAETGGNYGVNYISGVIGKMEYEGILKIQGTKGDSMFVTLLFG